MSQIEKSVKPDRIIRVDADLWSSTRAENARLRDALRRLIGVAVSIRRWSGTETFNGGMVVSEGNVKTLQAEADVARSALSTPAQPDPREAEVAMLREALRAYWVLDERRDKCEECGDTPEIAAEACGECMPFADDARCKMRTALTADPGEWLEEQLEDARKAERSLWVAEAEKLRVELLAGEQFENVMLALSARVALRRLAELKGGK